jgi:hypothetical protein
MAVADLSPATLVTIKVSRRHPNMVICALERAKTGPYSGSADRSGYRTATADAACSIRLATAAGRET